MKQPGVNCGEVALSDAFRCRCGNVVVMGNLSNGKGTTLHEPPYCAAYAALSNRKQARKYFASLRRIELTEQVVSQVTGHQVKPICREVHRCPECGLSIVMDHTARSVIHDEPICDAFTAAMVAGARVPGDEQWIAFVPSDAIPRNRKPGQA